MTQRSDPKRIADDRADVVRRYLAALAARDWPGLAATVAPEVVRTGPYNDVYRGRGAYVEFLAATFRQLSGYTLEVARVLVAGASVVVELSETVDADAGRRRTDEAVVFDVCEDGLIAAVTVYLRR